MEEQDKKLDLLKELVEAGGDIKKLLEKMEEKIGEVGKKRRRKIFVHIEEARTLFNERPEILQWKDKDGGNLAHVLCEITLEWEDGYPGKSEKRRKLLRVMEEIKPGYLMQNDLRGHPPIIRAAIKHSLNMIEDLEKLGVSLDTKDKGGRSIAFWATGHGGRDILGFLFAKDKDIFEIDKKDGAFAFACARLKIAIKGRTLEKILSDVKSGRYKVEVVREPMEDVETMASFYEEKFGYEKLKELIFSRLEEFGAAARHLRAEDLIEFAKRNELGAFSLDEELKMKMKEIIPIIENDKVKWTKEQIEMARREKQAIDRYYNELGR